MVELLELVVDLRAEQDELSAILKDLAVKAWSTPTPAPRWTIAHQVAHLAFFDEAVRIALCDPEKFAVIRAAAQGDPGYGDAVIEPLARLTPRSLLERWRRGADAVVDLLLDADPGVRVPWFGPSMSVKSKVTARLMETWAHGQDVVDAIGIDRPATDRVRHVVDLAIRARPYAYQIRGLPLPSASVRVDLIGPGAGAPWVFNPDATATISGSAEDFALVMTRRRHVDDTGLVATPGPAAEWLQVGQAYAGDPGVGRAPGQFAPTKI